MQEKRYRTVGEMIYLDEKFRTDCPWNENGYILTPRNKSGDYKHTVLRDMLADEVMKIFKAQRALGNDTATESLKGHILTLCSVSVHLTWDLALRAGTPWRALRTESGCVPSRVRTEKSVLQKLLIPLSFLWRLRR